LAVLVEPADRTDRAAARWLFQAVDHRWTRLQKVWADQAYNGDLGEWLRTVYGIELEVVGRPAGQQGFQVLPRRWVVERTIAWQGRHRRLSKDYEHTAAASETWCYIASIALLLRRLRPDPTVERPYLRNVA